MTTFSPFTEPDNSPNFGLAYRNYLPIIFTENMLSGEFLLIINCSKSLRKNNGNTFAKFFFKARHSSKIFSFPYFVKSSYLQAILVITQSNTIFAEISVIKASNRD